MQSYIFYLYDNILLPYFSDLMKKIFQQVIIRLKTRKITTFAYYY